MLKAILAVIVAGVIAIASAGLAHAQSFVEVQTKATSPHDGVTVLGNLNRPITGPWSVSAFFLTTSGWAEVYAGPTLALNQGKMAITLSMGGEQGDMNGLQPRYAVSVWATGGRFSLLGIIEVNNDVLRGNNDDGLWYELTMKAKILPWLYAGYKDKRNSGMGPYVQVKSRHKVGVWAAWMPFGPEDLRWQPKKVLVGIQLGI